ncbi:hypothetical protein ABZ756_13730 [Mammaliicoccus sciuri]
MSSSMKVNIQVNGLDKLKALIEDASSQIDELQGTLDTINSLEVEVKAEVASSQNQ